LAVVWPFVENKRSRDVIIAKVSMTHLCDIIFDASACLNYSIQLDRKDKPSYRISIFNVSDLKDAAKSPNNFLAFLQLTRAVSVILSVSGWMQP
jgi:hypothetical protein